MYRRRTPFLVFSLGLLLAPQLACAGQPPSAAPGRPNIVFILTDDQAEWTLGVSGNRQAHTPHLDRLAREGARLTQALVPTPVCSPARASLFTSRYGSEVGILDFIPQPTHAEYSDETGAVGLERRFVTFAEVLARAGYTNGLFGKWHLGAWEGKSDRRFHPTNHGFHTFMGLTGGGTTPSDPPLEINGEVKKFQGWTDDILTGHAIDFVGRARSQPFLAVLALRAPHGPWLPTAPEDQTPHEAYDPQIPEPNYPDLDVARVKRMSREYAASVSGVDRNVGRVLAALDRLKLAENTVVIFTSDHGFNLGHNGIYHKGNGIWVTKTKRPDRPNLSGKYRPNLYDHSLRTPALVRWPGQIRPGALIGETVSSLDWFPTLVALAGGELRRDEVVRGRSLLPLLRGEKIPGWDNDFYAEYSMRIYCRTDLRMYRTAQWKLVRDFLNPTEDELYDLRADPAESRNRINDTADPVVRAAVAGLDARIREKMRSIRDPLLGKIEPGRK